MIDDDDKKPDPPPNPGSKGEEPKDDYKVGKNRPPVETRFKKGTSGNPGGKPKKPPSLDLPALLSRVLSKPRQYTENGRTRTAPVLEIIYEATASRAAKGNMRAVRELSRTIKDYGLGMPPVSEEDYIDHGAEVRRKLAEMHDRLTAAGKRKGLDGPEPAKDEAEDDKK